MPPRLKAIIPLKWGHEHKHGLVKRPLWLWHHGIGVTVKYSTGLAVSLGVLLTGFFTWGVSTHPDGFGGLVQIGERAGPGAVPLALSDIDKQADSLTYAAVAQGVAQPAIFPFPPPDQSALDESFLAFLKDLRASVEIGDKEAVFAISHPQISYSFGADPGLDGFRTHLEDPEFGQDVWDGLKQTINLPAGKASGDDWNAHCTPYFWCMDMPEEAGIIDPYETVFIMGEDVPVYTGPGEDTDVVTHLTHAAVRALDAWEHPGWVLISLGANEEGVEQEGYVSFDHARGLLDYRAVFEKIEGSWTMTIFIAGD